MYLYSLSNTSFFLFKFSLFLDKHAPIWFCSTVDPLIQGFEGILSQGILTRILSYAGRGHKHYQCYTDRKHRLILTLLSSNKAMNDLPGRTSKELWENAKTYILLLPPQSLHPNALSLVQCFERPINTYIRSTPAPMDEIMAQNTPRRVLPLPCM